MWRRYYNLQESRTTLHRTLLVMVQVVKYIPAGDWVIFVKGQVGQNWDRKRAEVPWQRIINSRLATVSDIDMIFLRQDPITLVNIVAHDRYFA